MGSLKQRLILMGLVLTIVIGGLGIIRLLGMIGQPFGGFMTFYNGITGQYNMESGTPPWWTARRVYNIPSKGALHAIGEYPYSGTNERALYQQLVRDGETRPILEGWYDGITYFRKVALIPFTLRHFFDLKAPDILLAVVFWLLAFVVFQTRPNHTHNQVFALMCALFALNRCLENVTLYETDSIIDRTLMYINAAIYGPLSGALFIHFAMSFPTVWHPRFYYPILIASYGFAIVIMGSFATSYYLLLTYGFSRLSAELDAFGFYRMWYFYVGALGLIVVRLVWEALLHWKERRMQRQLMILAIGFITASPFVIIRLLLILNIRLAEQHYISTLDTRFFLLGIPIAFAYVIIRYQTFRGAPPIFLIAVALTGSAFIANIINALIYLLNPHWLNDKDHAISWLLLLAIFATALFAGAQGRLRGSLGRLLQSTQYDYDAVRRFGQKLLRVADPALMAPYIVDEMVHTMELERAALYLWDGPNKTFQHKASAGMWPIELPKELSSQIDTPLLPEEPIRLGRDALPNGFHLPSDLVDTIEIVVFLTSNGNLIGVLCTSRRWDEVEPNEQFEDILRLVTQQATLFLITAQQILYLKGIPHIISQAQEKIQMHLARDLHDAVQQYFTRMPLNLETLRFHLNRWDLDGANELLDSYTEDTVTVSEDLYRIRADLAPHHLRETMNLTRSLRELGARFNHRTGIDVESIIEDGLDESVLPELRLTFYRTIQQALENIHHHAKATNVWVHVFKAKTGVQFEVKDDGRGFNVREALASSDRFGLHSMQSRIREDCQGEIEWTSRVGGGTRVFGWIPLLKTRPELSVWVPLAST